MLYKKNVRLNYELSQNVMGIRIYRLCTMKYCKNTDIFIALIPFKIVFN